MLDDIGVLFALLFSLGGDLFFDTEQLQAGIKDRPLRCLGCFELGNLGFQDALLVRQGAASELRDIELVFGVVLDFGERILPSFHGIDYALFLSLGDRLGGGPDFLLGREDLQFELVLLLGVELGLCADELEVVEQLLGGREFPRCSEAIGPDFGKLGCIGGLGGGEGIGLGG